MLTWIPLPPPLCRRALHIVVVVAIDLAQYRKSPPEGSRLSPRTLSWRLLLRSSLWRWSTRSSSSR